VLTAFADEYRFVISLETVMDDSNMDQPTPLPLEVTHPHLKDFAAFLPELNKESDKGMVLIATSFVDKLLKRIVLVFLVEGKPGLSLVDGFNAPLGTFSSRTAAAVALGLIPDREYKECDILRKIRNQFAHHVHISFEDNGIRDQCRNLTMAAQDYDEVVVDARGRFSTSAVCLILNLTNRPHYVAKSRRSFSGWPD
jgi:hypothetical protein